MMPVSLRRGGSSDGGAAAPRLNVVAVLILLVSIAIGIAMSAASGNPIPVLAAAAIGVVLMQSPKVAKQWERAVLLRLGRFTGLQGPGIFWIVPFVDTVSSWIDQRTITTSFAAEQTLTSDTVPVNVDAVLFWMVHDAQKAALEVQDYSQAISWAAQTALRDIIGRTALTDLLRGRERIEAELQHLIDQRSDGRLSYHVASLYPTLYRLEDRGLVEGRWVERAGQRRRRYYKITASGRRTLKSERSAWQQFFFALDRVARIRHA